MKHIFWHVILPIAIIAGANAYDWKTTADSIRSGNVESTSAFMIGRRPSNLKITVGGGSVFALETFTYLRGEKHDKLKWFTRAAVGYQVSDHIRLGIHNESICNTVTRKSPFSRRRDNQIAARKDKADENRIDKPRQVPRNNR